MAVGNLSTQDINADALYTEIRRDYPNAKITGVKAHLSKDKNGTDYNRHESYAGGKISSMVVLNKMLTGLQ